MGDTNWSQASIPWVSENHEKTALKLLKFQCCFFVCVFIYSK